MGIKHLVVLLWIKNGFKTNLFQLDIIAAPTLAKLVDPS